MKDYDIGEAFQRIEEEMISSMSRNLQRHLTTEAEEDLNYPMWQAEQLAAINEFKQNNKKMFSGTFSAINAQVEDVLKRANASGKMEQEAKILEAIQKGWRTVRPGSGLQASFFKINERKMKALISAITKDLKKAEYAMLRRADDIYRKTVFNAQVFYNSGAGTLPQCVDMATKDFLSRGIDCIEYSNGARVGIDAYSRMALRTAETRAYLQGESTKRDEWGVNTVIVNKRGAACPKCLQWVGKVYYDDVYCSTPVKDDKYPLLSTAIAGGLYHPNCKDIHTTYFEGVSTKPQPITQKQVDEANRVYALEQRQRYNERMIRKYKRLADGSVDEKNKEKYKKAASAWKKAQHDFISRNSDVPRPRSELQQGMGLPNIPRRFDDDFYNRYRQVLNDLVPDTVDKFEDTRYNKPDEWNSLKYNYRTVNRYTVDGDVPPKKILELDRAAWQTKQTGFDMSNYHGRNRNRVKDTKGGNAAAMEFDGKTYFAHSKASVPGEPEYDSYVGEYELIGLRKDRKFKTRMLGDGVPREHDTEAKFLEFVASAKDPADTFEVTILSEKHICESCQGVVDQFTKMYPNAKVNIVSGKLGYNGDPKGGNTWKYRKKVK